jgi:hypothetical protein
VLVEVAVTHFVDQKKLALIQQLGYDAIAIDLSKVRDATFAALETALFDDPARTKWLYHPGIPAAHAELLQSIQGDLKVAEELAARWAARRAADEEAERQKQAELQRAVQLADEQVLAEAGTIIECKNDFYALAVASRCSTCPPC